MRFQKPLLTHNEANCIIIKEKLNFYNQIQLQNESKKNMQ